MPVSIREHIQTVHQRITNACQQSGRSVRDVRLLLATKTVAADQIRQAIAAGETLIGENKVQELRDKDPELHMLPIERHFIGHLQTNKIKEVLKYVSCIQSLDRLELAQRLDQQLQKSGKSVEVYIQVNTSYEASKYGLPPEKVLSFIQSIRTLDTLRIKGLMTIGLLDVDKEKMRPSLRLLSQIKDQIHDQAIEGVENLKLSMGMSQDLELAIAEGSNLVRVGTSIFGNRFSGREIWKE